ncbi:MAG: mechanosensitive ion channel [Firmicutes bacterium]|nr:mechanosensitive ion channel [Bacillota bacterium]
MDKTIEKTMEKLTDGLFDVAMAVVILLIGAILIKLLLRFTKKILEKSSLDESVYLFVMRAVKIALWIVLIVAVLPMIGIPAASLVTVLGAGGAAIALALKDSLGNVAGGILILINKPFVKGDTIELAEVTGVVDSIDLLTTQLHTFDNKIVTVPNGTITTSVLINYSREELRRVDCQFTISYDSDIAKAKELLYNVADCNELILKDREPVIGVAEQGDSGILLDLKVWCSTSDYFDVKYYLEENVKIAFDEAGIDIPYKTMDVHIIK